MNTHEKPTRVLSEDQIPMFKRRIYGKRSVTKRY